MEKKDRTRRVGGILLALLVIFIIIIFLILNSGHVTNTGGESENDVVTALDCKANGIEGQFFSSSTANTIENQVKVTFKNDKPEKLFYVFEGVYRDYDVADHDNAVLHAKYNERMSGNGLEQGSLTPTFSTVKTKMRINLYAKEPGIINRATAVLFFIKEDDVEKYLDYSRDEVADYYKKQGFSCEKQN